MHSVTISPEYEVAIPRAICDKLRLQPGHRMLVFAFDGRIEMIPERDIEELRGCLSGIDDTFDREPDRI